jgi:hypothetical protein
MSISKIAAPLCLAMLYALTPGLAHSQSAVSEAERQLDSAQLQLQLAKQAQIAGLKELTSNCVAVPLTTTVSGSVWTFEAQTSATARVRGSLWRVPCAGTDSQLILTLQPMLGTPFVCGTDLEIRVGAAVSSRLFLDSNPNDGVATDFCGNLAATTSFVINNVGAGFSFDDDAAFTLNFRSSIGLGASVAIPAFDPSLHLGLGLAANITGSLSGSYYAATRTGEGVQVEIGRIGSRRVLFLTWYTYFQGQQRWIVGSADLSAGATVVTVPLFVTTGGQFGSGFNPAQVSMSSWGSATLEFPNCSSMRFQWNESAGASGEYVYARSMEGLDGVLCL